VRARPIASLASVLDGFGRGVCGSDGLAVGAPPPRSSIEWRRAGRHVASRHVASNEADSIGMSPRLGRSAERQPQPVRRSLAPSEVSSMPRRVASTPRHWRKIFQFERPPLISK
jgi:hypothetical protein